VPEPLSREFLLGFGQCCGGRCTNCPYVPKYKRGSTVINQCSTKARGIAMDMVSQELQDLGLSLTLEFLTPNEEKILLEKINNIQRRRAVGGSARTSVSRFGSDQYYGSHMQSKIIPDYLME
jgi:hypothetical protein